MSLDDIVKNIEISDAAIKTITTLIGRTLWRTKQKGEVTDEEFNKIFRSQMLNILSLKESNTIKNKNLLNESDEKMLKHAMGLVGGMLGGAVGLAGGTGGVHIGSMAGYGAGVALYDYIAKSETTNINNLVSNDIVEEVREEDIVEETLISNIQNDEESKKKVRSFIKDLIKQKLAYYFVSRENHFKILGINIDVGDKAYKREIVRNIKKAEGSTKKSGKDSEFKVEIEDAVYTIMNDLPLKDISDNSIDSIIDYLINNSDLKSINSKLLGESKFIFSKGIKLLLEEDDKEKEESKEEEVKVNSNISINKLFLNVRNEALNALRNFKYEDKVADMINKELEKIADENKQIKQKDFVKIISKMSLTPLNYLNSLRSSNESTIKNKNLILEQGVGGIGSKITGSGFDPKPMYHVKGAIKTAGAATLSKIALLVAAIAIAYFAYQRFNRSSVLKAEPEKMISLADAKKEVEKFKDDFNRTLAAIISCSICNEIYSNKDSLKEKGVVIKGSPKYADSRKMQELEASARESESESSEADLDQQIEELCTYFTMEFNKKEVDDLDKRKMHKSEDEKANKYGLIAGGLAAGVGVGLATLFTGGGAALPLLAGIVAGTGGGVYGAATELDDWKANPDKKYSAARDMCQRDIKNLKKIIVKIKGLRKETNRNLTTSIKRKYLEDLLRANSVLGYKTKDKEMKEETICRISSLINTELDISVEGVSFNSSHSHQNAAINATTDRNASVGTPANQNLANALQGSVPAMTDGKINDPLTLLSMMNRGGGDLASLLLVLILSKSGTFENLLGNISSGDGVTTNEVTKEIVKAAEEVKVEEVPEASDIDKLLNDSAKRLERDKPYLRKNAVKEIIKELRKHTDFLYENNFIESKDNINGDFEIVSSLKHYFNFVSDDKKIDDIPIAFLKGRLGRIINSNFLIELIILKNEEVSKTISNNELNDLKNMLESNIDTAFNQFIYEYNIKNSENKFAEVEFDNTNLNYNLVDVKDVDKAKNLLKYFNDKFDRQFKLPGNADDSSTQTTPTSASIQNASFIRGRLSDLLFEKVDIIESRTKSQKRKTYLERELYRVWNIRK